MFMTSKKPSGRNDGHSFDYSKVNDLLYLGSDFCVGRECKLHESEFKKMGVCVELNLAAEKKEIPPDNICVYVWMPVVDGYAPTPNQMLTGTSLINESIVNGNAVYVHCKNGHGRSPTMIVAYLVRFKGMSIPEAIDFVKSKRPEIHIEKTQLDALKKFEEKWSK
jgi:protein-tyrosine phosphatase